MDGLGVSSRAVSSVLLVRSIGVAMTCRYDMFTRNVLTTTTFRLSLGAEYCWVIIGVEWKCFFMCIEILLSESSLTYFSLCWCDFFLSRAFIIQFLVQIVPNACSICCNPTIQPSYSSVRNCCLLSHGSWLDRSARARPRQPRLLI